jgi:hypothetical protein
MDYWTARHGASDKVVDMPQNFSGVPGCFIGYFRAFPIPVHADASGKPEKYLIWT